MPAKRNSRDDDPLLRNDNLGFPGLSDEEIVEGESDEQEDDGATSAGLAGMMQQLRKLKKNPNLLKGVAAGSLLLLLLLLLGWLFGWFGGGADKKASGVAARTAQSRPAPRTPAPAKPSYHPPKPLPTQSKTKPEEPAKEDELPLPDDVTKWKKQDYFRARRENNPKLLEAVLHLGERFRGSAPAAEGLTELLKPLPPEPPPAPDAKPPAPGIQPPRPGMQPPRPGVQPQRRPGQTLPAVRPRNPAEITKLVEAIVAALGVNGSDSARETLEQILAGRLTTDDDKAAVEAALKSLVANPCTENDALLLRVLVATEALRPADRQGPWPAKQLRDKAFELVKQGASSELRAKLAETMADRLVRITATDPIREFILAPDPLNCNAQLVLYATGGGTKEIRTRLEQQLLGYSSAALGRLLELTVEPPAAAVRHTAIAGPAFRPAPGMAVPGLAAQASVKGDADMYPRIAGLLWSEKFVGLVESQLGERSFEKQPQLILLAGTIPQDSVRAALAKLARKSWHDGPKALEAAGFPDRVITDPAMLVLVKMFPRKEIKTQAKTPPRVSSRGKRTTAAPAGDTLKATQKKGKEQAEQDWMTVSSKLVAAWCKRCHEAVLAKEKAAVESGSPIEAAEPKLPADFKLSPDAKVIASYRVSWPDEAPAAVADLKPGLLELHYVRVEETNQPKKAAAFYGRQVQARAADNRTMDNKTTWIDSLRSDTKTDRRRSVDVLITRTDNKTGDDDDEETDLIVEILAVEINDPAARD